VAEFESGRRVPAVVVPSTLVGEVETDTGARDRHQPDLGVSSLLDTDHLQLDDAEVLHARVVGKEHVCRPDEVRRRSDLERGAVELLSCAGTGGRELVHHDRRVAKEGVDEASLVVDFERDDPLGVLDGREGPEERRHDGFRDSAGSEIVKGAALGEPPFLRLVDELVEAPVAADSTGSERVGRGGEEDPPSRGAPDGGERDSVGRDRETGEVERDLLFRAAFGDGVTESDEGHLGGSCEDEEVRDRVDKDTRSRTDKGDADNDIGELFEGREGGAAVGGRVSSARFEGREKEEREIHPSAQSQRSNR
jgi:hypothetical protein